MNKLFIMRQFSNFYISCYFCSFCIAEILSTYITVPVFYISFLYTGRLCCLLICRCVCNIMEINIIVFGICFRCRTGFTNDNQMIIFYNGIRFKIDICSRNINSIYIVSAKSIRINIFQFLWQSNVIKIAACESFISDRSEILRQLYIT